MDSAITKIFFSYASKNSPIVTRVYDDLSRAGGNFHIWAYEIHSRYGVDFKKEYSQKLLSADIFILFDSQHARSSRYVGDEVSLWRKHKGSELYICLVEPPGNWRDQALFKWDKRWTYIDLNDYQIGIEALCQELGGEYKPKFTMPRDIDFSDELQKSQMALSVDERRELVRKYKYFRDSYAVKPEIAQAQLLVLIDEHLEVDDVDIISPYLALAVLQAEQGDASAALKTYEKIVKLWPHDPRGWAGQGYILFSIGQYPECIKSLVNCHNAIINSGEKTHHKHLHEVLYNLALAYSLNGQAQDALEALRSMTPADQEKAESKVISGCVMLELNRHDEAAQFFINACRAILSGNHLEYGVLLELALGIDRLLAIREDQELYQQSLGLFDYIIDLKPDDPELLRYAATVYCRHGQLDQGLEYYQLALKYQPKNIRLLAESALLNMRCDKREKAAGLIKRLLSREEHTAEDDYFTGLAHYLADRKEAAQYYFNKTRGHQTTGEWPHYSEL